MASQWLFIVVPVCEAGLSAREGEMVMGNEAATLRRYDAAVWAAHSVLEAGLPAFLSSARVLLDAFCVTLVIFDPARTSGYGVHEGEVPDHVPDIFSEGQARLWCRLPAEVAIRRSRHWEDSAFTRSNLYRQFYEPYGLLHQVIRDVGLGQHYGRLVVDRGCHEADFTSGEIEMVELLAHHLEWSYGNGRSVREGRLKIFGLTPAETRLARSLVSGQGLKNATLQLGISINTGKSQLRNIFEKTDTHRQAELVKLLLESGIVRSEL